MIIFLSLLCIVSVVINVILIWYIRKMLSKLLFVSDNIGDLLEEVDVFTAHLEAIHEMETYYGDTTLMGLIGHSKDLTKEIKKYREIYIITNEGLQITELEDANENQKEE